jgi:hypothetical protein
MRTSALFALTCLLAAPAWSQTAQPLDLSVPAPATPAAANTSADPPGIYYGDTSGKPAARRLRDEARAARDDGKAQVWGSVSTTVGHAEGVGTTWWNSANVNVSKAFGENNQNRATISIDVGTQDGPGFYPRHPRQPGWDETRWPDRP